MKTKLFFISFLLFGFLSRAQNFQWANVMFDYYSNSNNVLLDNEGNIYQFTRLFGSYSEYDSITKTYISYSNGTQIIKQTINGKTLWKTTFPGITNSMQLDKDGNVFLTGHFNVKADFDASKGVNILNPEGSDDVFILKFSTLGKLILAKKIGGKYSDIGYEIELDNKKNISIIGSYYGLVDFDPSAATYKINGNGSFKLKLDSSGNFLSVSTGKDNYLKKEKDLKGNLYVTGSFSGKIDIDPDSTSTFYLTSRGDQDVFVQKLDPNGKLLWAKSMGGILTDKGNSLVIDKNQNVYITGSFEDSIDLDPSTNYNYFGSSGKTDAFICKLDSNGNFIWGNAIGGIDKELGNIIVLDDSSNVYCYGLYEDTVDFDPGINRFMLRANKLQDMFILKLNSNGKFNWVKTFGGTDQEYITSIAIDKAQNIYCGGFFRGTMDFDPDISKYDIKANSTYNSFLFKLGPCPSPVSIIYGTKALCGGVTKATYSISPASGANGYKWTVPAGATIDSGQGSTKIKVTFGSNLGDITVRPNNICDTTLKAVLTIKNFPAAIVKANSNSSTTICKTGSVYLYGTGANTYTWNKGVVDRNYFTPDSTDTYVVIGTDLNGCMAKDSITIIVSGVATPTSIQGLASVCGRDKAIYSVTPIAGAKGYTWTVPNGAKIDSGQNTATIYVTFGNNSGYISVNTINACNTNPFSQYISVVNSNIGITVTPSSTICKGTSITLGVTGSSNYTWTGGITSGISFKPDTTTTYTVKETGSSGCSGTNSITINVNPLPKITANVTPPKVCSGGSVKFTGNGAQNYTWSGGVKDNQLIKVNTSLRYVVTGTDLNGCKDTSSIQVDVLPIPKIIEKPSNQVVKLNSDAKFIVSTEKANLKYQWQVRIEIPYNTYENINNSIRYSGTNSDTLTIYNVSANYHNFYYRCIITNDDECSVISNPVILYVNTTSISKQKKAPIISVYPNPAINFLTIELDVNTIIEKFEITDHTGKQILNGVLTSQSNEVDISHLANGLYFIQIGNENKETFRFVKQ